MHTDDEGPAEPWPYDNRHRQTKLYESVLTGLSQAFKNYLSQFEKDPTPKLKVMPLDDLSTNLNPFAAFLPLNRVDLVLLADTIVREEEGRKKKTVQLSIEGLI